MTSPPPAPLSLALACPADSFWERWCRNASPEQKSPILPPAIRSGVVQLHQLPVPGLQANRNAVQILIASIVANRPPSLDPVVPACVRVVDDTLDDDQRHAVAVALGSPDLSLIVGYPGSGKSRVVAEILRQAAGRGQRVLFASPAGAALDRVIDRAPDLGPHVLRCTGAGETLPARSAALSLQERIRHFDEETLPAARRCVEEARAHLARLAPLEDAWPRLRATPARLDALATRVAALERRRDSLASVVATEWASPLIDQSAPEWAEPRRKHLEAERQTDARLREIATRLGTLQGETTRLNDERGPLAALAAARNTGRWWSPSCWKARRQPDPSLRLGEIDRLLATRRAELASLEQESSALEATRQRSRLEHAASGADLCRAEVRRREAEIARELHAMTVERAALEAEWSAVLPAEVRPDAVEAAEQAWRTEYAAASLELDRLQAWLSALEQARPGLAFEFVLSARILAAPVPEVMALGTDRSPGAFDLLVLEDAHRVAEKDLLSLNRLAPRCVFVGEPGVPVPKSAASARAGLARPADPSVLLRLWATLHPDPVRVSAHWTRRGDRLSVRLQPFAPDDENEIAREPVFDRPEIELAIRTPPGGIPQLVEVVFPSAMCVADAKAFLYRESGELSIHAAGPGFRWQEAGDAVHLHFGPSDVAGEERVALDAGVVEHLGRPDPARAGDPAWHTLGLSFGRAGGWDRDSAAGWIGERLGLRDFGRTAFLPRVYRARPALSSILGELLFPRGAGSTQPPACDAAEFVPCGEAREWIPLHDGGTAEASSPSNGATALAPSVGRPRLGAGLEVDLGDGRRLDAIGPELRSALPPRGIVNFPEACLVVQTLESLVADSRSLASAGDTEPHVAVLSLQPAQVELLRLLVRRSPALAESGLLILVGHPAALAHRECPLVCLSLTRSHCNRAVPFSDDPRDLVLALTRATQRLFVFGDPGTMTRRSKWFGALDHLTEATGPVEQHLLARLLDRLPERAAPILPNAALESSGV